MHTRWFWNQQKGVWHVPTCSPKNGLKKHEHRFAVGRKACLTVILRDGCHHTAGGQAGQPQAV